MAGWRLRSTGAVAADLTLACPLRATGLTSRAPASSGNVVGMEWKVRLTPPTAVPATDCSPLFPCTVGHVCV